MFSNIFPSKIIPFMRNVEEFCTNGQAPDDNITRRMRIACWVLKATNTHSEYDFLLPRLFTNAPQYYVIRIWSLLLCISMWKFM